MKICVLGLWHLGAVTAACLAEAGHDVLGLDPDAAVVQGLSRGRAAVSEPGLNELLAAQIKAGRLAFAAADASVPGDTELLWVAFDTPVDEDDNADVEFVMNAVQSVLPRLRRGATVLVNSQLPAGSVRRLEQAAAQQCPQLQLEFAASPENLRLGKALQVFREPDRVVVGVRGAAARDCVARALAPLKAPVEWMSVESAEMTKHAINAFLATSVVFANELAAVCEAVGADAKEVERGLKTESRIGSKAYVAPGGAFAGGTLARDVQFLNQFAARHGLANPMLHAIRDSNRLHKQWALRRLRELLGEPAGRRVAVWGLTYKPGTDTLRRSLAVELCDQLLDAGAQLQVHDPAVPQLPAHWDTRVRRFDAPLDALQGVAALIVATEWPLYREAVPAAAAKAAPGLLVLDANRFLASWRDTPGLRYAAVGTVSGEGAA